MSAMPRMPALALLFVACSNETPKPEPSASAPVALATTAAPSAAPPPVTSAPPPPPSSSAPTKAPPRTGRPSPKKWCEAPTLHHLQSETTEDGQPIPGCTFLEVEEWILVACPMSSKLGNYDKAVPGGGSIATPAEVAAGPDPSAKDAVVISLRPGTTAKPLFFYRPVAHPEWAKTETFEFSMPESATGLDDRSLPRVYRTEPRDTSRCADLEPAAAASAASSASPSAAAAAPPQEPKELPDIPDHPPPPAEEAWAAEREVMASGSDALGCKTKLKDSWFYARCEGKVTFTSVDVERGRHATQTTAVVKDGTVMLLTPYVEGTDLRARLVFDGGERFLKLRWPAGKRPYEVAKITEAR